MAKRHFIRVEIKPHRDGGCHEMCPYLTREGRGNGFRCDLFGALRDEGYGDRRMSRHPKCLEAERKAEADRPEPERPVRAHPRPSVWERLGKDEP